MKKQIKITFTKKTVENAREYIDTHNCLLCTALKEIGFDFLNVGPSHVICKSGRAYQISPYMKMSEYYDEDGIKPRLDAIGKSVTLKLI